MPTTAEIAAQAAAEILLLLVVATLFASAVVHAFVTDNRATRRTKRRGVTR